MNNANHLNSCIKWIRIYMIYMIIYDQWLGQRIVIFGDQWTRLQNWWKLISIYILTLSSVINDWVKGLWFWWSVNPLTKLMNLPKLGNEKIKLTKNPIKKIIKKEGNKKLNEHTPCWWKSSNLIGDKSFGNHF